MVFESGRTGNGVRIFKAGLPSDPSPDTAAPDAPSRLTGDDSLASETNPVVSADGARVALIGTDASGNRSAWSVPWAGGAATMLSVSGEQVFDLGFSPDSALFAYGSILASGATAVTVVDTANPQTRGTLTTGARKVGGLRWLATGAGYKLATISLSGATGVSVTNIETWTFNNVAGVAAAAATTLTGKATVAAQDDLSAWLTQDANKIITVQSLTPSADRSVGEIGPGALSERKIFARQELLFLDPGTGAESVGDNPQGDVILGVSASQNLTLVAVNETTRCLAGGLSSRASILKVSATPATASSFERLVVRKTSTGKTFDLVSDPCDVTLVTEGAALDLAAGEAVISGGAITGNLTVAYVSVITGDPEVLVIRRGSGSTKVWDVSANSL
ncbi:MAG: hypothetical protein RIQ81_106 [Pseudomonadota bacterium]